MKSTPIALPTTLHDGATSGQSASLPQAMRVSAPFPGQSSRAWQLTIKLFTSAMLRQQVVSAGQSAGVKQGTPGVSQPRESKLAGSTQSATAGAFLKQHAWPGSQTAVPQCIGASDPPSPADSFGGVKSHL